MEFDTALKEHSTAKQRSSQAGALYGSIISYMVDSKEAAETADALPGFWKSIPVFEQYVLPQAVESRVSRALLMLASSKAYDWVASIASEAVKNPTKPDSWVCQLAKDVGREWRYRNSNPNHPKEAVFDSKKYLPILKTPCEAVVTLNRWGHIQEKDQEIKITQAVSFIIETWLQFPTTKHQQKGHKVRCALISILIKNFPISVLFLDHVWFMFLKPYQLLLHGRLKQRITTQQTAATVKLFEESIQKHAMAQSTSKEHLLLKVLQEYSSNWFQLSSLRTPKEYQPVAPLINDVRFFCFFKYYVLIF